MDLIRKVVELRMRFVPLIMDLARECAISGEPMLRSMEYAFPGRGYEGIKDQFLLGEGLLVAPVLESGARARSVTLPPGRWRDPSGRVHEGACRIEVSASLETLPYFEAEQAMKRSSQEIP
jgi:alpha-glucosidase